MEPSLGVLYGLEEVIYARGTPSREKVSPPPTAWCRRPVRPAVGHRLEMGRRWVGGGLKLEVSTLPYGYDPTAALEPKLI